jgi:hypothetical protein
MESEKEKLRIFGRTLLVCTGIGALIWLACYELFTWLIK